MMYDFCYFAISVSYAATEQMYMSAAEVYKLNVMQLSWLTEHLLIVDFMEGLIWLSVMHTRNWICKESLTC